jgi:hypothetical protein
MPSIRERATRSPLTIRLVASMSDQVVSERDGPCPQPAGARLDGWASVMAATDGTAHSTLPQSAGV